MQFLDRLACPFPLLLMQLHAGKTEKAGWFKSTQFGYSLPVRDRLVPAILILPQLREGFGFYALFALAVTASVQLVGVFLVFASLIVPALATAGMQRRRLAAAWGIGLAGYVVGLFGSSVFDLPAGPAVVWAMAACALAKATVGRR